MRWAFALLLVTGCEGLVGEMPLDAAVEDAAILDAGHVDSGTPDAGASDAGTPDAGVLDAGGDDAGLADAGAPDAGTPPFDAGTRQVEVLVAQGRLGRTTISCDDGLTWVLDRDEANGTQCGDPPLEDCFHHEWSSMGLVHTGTSVLATWGWGATPGRVRRTIDGVTWDDAVTGTRFSGLASGGGVVLGSTNPPRTSTSDGMMGSWVMGGSVQTGTVSRHTAYVPAGTGRFVMVFDDVVVASDDRGATWSPLPVPSNCQVPVMGVLAHDATLVLVHWAGSVCASTDRGATWALRSLDSGFTSKGVYALGAFHVWNGATRHRSTDGLTWTSANGSPGDVQIGPVAVTAAGTYVAFKGGWQSEYQYERVYRSTDGLNWQTIPAANHAHSHPITHLVSGPLRASAACP